MEYMPVTISVCAN